MIQVETAGMPDRAEEGRQEPGGQQCRRPIVPKRERSDPTVADIRILTEEHYGEFVRIQAEAYPGLNLWAPGDRSEALERIKKRRDDPRVSFYGLFRRNRLIAGMRLHDFALNLRGVAVPCGGIGAVAVDLAHKRERACGDLVTFYLNHFLERGTPMLSLWPFRPDFYRKMGFGLGGRIYRYTFAPDALPARSGKHHVRLATPADAKALQRCYARYFQRTHGLLDETEDSWRNTMNHYPKRQIYVYDSGQGEVLGYMIFEFTSDASGNWLANDLEVFEFVYENRQVLSEMLAFLGSQKDQVGRIVLQTPDPEFHFALNDPRDGTGALMMPVYHSAGSTGVGVMYRVLDLRTVFQALTGTCFNPLSLKLKITLRDPFFRRNQASTPVQFINGRPKVLSSDRATDCEISLDISDFSSMLMGAVTLESLYTYGLADISDGKYLSDISNLFYIPRAAYCRTLF